MVEAVFSPMGRRAYVSRGTSILEAARRAGVTIESPCNGQGTCGKCLVQVNKTSRSLACLTPLLDSSEIDVPESQTDLRILAQGQALDVPLEPYFRKIQRQGKTLTLAGDDVVAVETGESSTSLLGVVVDIGTTTLVVSLVDLTTGAEIGCLSALNPQALHAQDVLSRISLASRPDGLELLFAAVSGEIDRLIGRLIEQSGARRQEIWEVIYSGNTCMLHLATGTDPASLGKHPYTVVLPTGRHISAKQCRLSLNSAAQVFLPPVMSAYVGADISAGLVASRLHELSGTTLFIDIGTNGEMAVARDGVITASSTAAGPAFEGMNITCGMRAGPGAIERYDISADGTVTWSTIADKSPIGICGSGLLDLVGALVAAGVVDRNGKFVRSTALADHLDLSSPKPVYRVTADVTLSQKDVRQVQLAKAAIRCGVDLLLDAVQLPPQRVDRVYIAGSFGFHLQAESLFRLGLLPRAFQGKIHFLGNTAKTGGHAMLINASARRNIADVTRQVRVLELAGCGDFQKVFVKNLYFEETGRLRASQKESSHV